MKNRSYLLLCVVIMACSSKPQGNTQADSAKNTVKASAYSGPFDLANLSLNENIIALMAAQGIKPEKKDSLDLTMLNFEVFKSSNPKALRFKNADLSGTNGKNKNYVLFHYNEEKKTLACYQIDIYNQQQTDTLISLLNSMGKLIFKQTHLPKGSIALDENGDEIKPEHVKRKTFRVWENKSTGLSYFLSEDGQGKSLATELIVLNRSTQFGKDWISSLQLDWYKKDTSEPLP